jgi:RNA-dependent RNA polymerase
MFSSVFRLFSKSKVDIMSEPLISLILYGIQLCSYQAIKKKARILVPKSATLIGTVDSEGILEENEIFVQIRRDSFKCNDASDERAYKRAQVAQLMDGNREVLSGDVMVTRNPCLHPGDIRVLTAVDRPEFKHLYNVVVFSSKGKRPMCNMMAGGDLDGDVYFVCWDDKLLGKELTKDMVQEPAKYEKPKILTEKPDGDSLADYFVFYLERDVLGKIANLHLALSDYYGREGPMHEDCVYLSHLASVAVDFAKHGECVHVDAFQRFEKLLIDEAGWPDFFEKEAKLVRKSDGILGILYRSITATEPMKDF